MQTLRKRKVITGLTMASSLAWMSIVPATAVMAQGLATVTPGSVHLSGPLRPTNGSAMFTASASDPNGTAEYQFWVQSPTGQWSDMQNYSTRNTFTLATPSQGDYLVVVDVLDQGQVAAGDWSMAQTTMPDGVFNGSTVSVASSASGSVAKGTSITLTAASSGIFSPLYQFWYQDPSGTWHQSGAYQSGSTYTFTAGLSGTYKFVAYAKSPQAANDQHGALQSSVGKQVSYGTASQVVASPAMQTVVADKAAPGMVTYTVEDSHGDRVANFTGTLTLNDSGAGLGISIGGTTSGNMYAVTGGVATTSFMVPTNDAGRVVSIVADNLTTAATSAGGTAGQSHVANINYSSATAMVTAQTAMASALVLSSNVSGLSNNAADTAMVTVSVADQAGNPYPIGNTAYYAELTLTGSGSFSASSAQTSDVVELDSGNSAPTVPVYTPTGASGTVTISATPVSGDPLAAAAPVSISLYETGAPTQLAITSSMGVSGGLTYTTYTVMVEDANGHVISTGANSSGTLAVSANSGNLDLSRGASPTATSTGSYLSGIPVSNGVGTFTVENPLYQSSPATLTVTDSNSGIASASALYTYMVGTPGYAEMTTNYTMVNYSWVTGGATLTETAQLTDINGNPVAMANQPLYFRIYPASTGDFVLPNGSGGGGDVYKAMTNASGQATIQVTVPASDAVGRIGQMEASGPLGVLPLASDNAARSPVYLVTPLSDYVTSLKADLSGGTVTAGFTAGIYLGSYNGLGGVSVNEGGSLIQVTSSNSSVMSVASSTLTLYYQNGSSTTDQITAGLAGTATLTFTDLSQPNHPSTSVTFKVVPGPTFGQTLEIGGAAVSHHNPVNLPANTPEEVQVVNTDIGHNPVPVTGTTPLAVGLNAPRGMQWETSSGGVGYSHLVVEIPAGSSSANVWLVSSTSNDFVSAGVDTGSYQVPSPITATATEASPDPTTGGHGVALSWTAPPSGASTLAGYQLWAIPAAGGSPFLVPSGDFQNTSGLVPSGTTSVTVNTSSGGFTESASYQFEVDAVYTTAPGAAVPAKDISPSVTP